MSTAPQIIDGPLGEVRERLNALPDRGQRAHVVVWIENEDAEVEAAAEDPSNADAIAYLRERLQKTLTDPEQVRRAEADLEELHRRLNRNRVEADERSLFPE